MSFAMAGMTPLHRAAQRGNEEEVAHLLDQGADMTARDGEHRTPLHHAVIRGHVGVVDLLLARGGPSLLLAKDVLGCTPVHLAAVQNQVTLIIRLVEALLRDEAGRTPLHEVARRRCMQDFMGFLHLGWESATFEDDSYCKPLAELSALWAAVAEVVDLSRPGLPTVQRVLGWHPLHVAAMSGNIELIRRLVQQFNCDLKVKSMNSWTPLHYAAAYNQVAAIEALISLGCEAVVPDAVGSTPIHVAAGEGHLEAIQELVRLGCSSQVVDRDGCTPLYCAAAWNRIEAVRLLEKLQCPSSLRSLEGRTAVHVAAEQGWVELIDVLIRELGNQVDARDNYQFTPLHSAANGGHVAAIQRLVALGHDLDCRDYLGRTPLHYAAMHGRVAALEELVRLGADMHQKDLRGGYTALHLAADAGQCDSVSRLVALGAPVDAPSNKGHTPLQLALLKGPSSIETICVLVELGADVAALLATKPLETPLHIAARSGRADIIERLVKCPQISVTCRTKDGSTALHYGAAFGQTHVLAPLVAAGCPVDSRDNALNTPLHLAAGCGFLDTVSELVALGADVNCRDVTDCTPLQNAAHGTYSALATVPSASTPASTVPALPPAASATGYARLNPPHQPQLTPAQQAAQAAITAGSGVKRDGMVPVRTGLAWAPAGGGTADALLGGATSLWGSGSFAAGLDFGAGGSSSAAAGGSGSSSLANSELWSSWRSLGFTKLLKKAYSTQRRQGSASGAASSGSSSNTAGTALATTGAQSQLAQTQQTVQAALQQMQAALVRSQEVLQQQLMLQLQTPAAPGAADSLALGLPATDSLLLDAAAGGTSANGSLSAAAGTSAAAGGSSTASQLLGGVDSSGLALAAAAAAITKPVVESGNMDCLARRTDQLSFAAGEQDRSRLIKVVERLVELGADLHLTDNEGRTALHLAAGCGDKSMALKLVELGTDVNCKDSVGGTAMHHAAMANKKDMMFALARLGCDWRARADGIDGATASFVLCGQHGKTTRQQKLLDAKLKRVAAEGAAARAAGRNPLIGEGKDDERDDATGDLEAEQALADAAMQALLEEEETEQEILSRAKSGGSSASKKKKQKAKAKAKSKAEALASSSAAPASTPPAGSSAPAAGEGAAEEAAPPAEAEAPAKRTKAAAAAAASAGAEDSAMKVAEQAAGGEAKQQQQQQQPRRSKSAAMLADVTPADMPKQQMPPPAAAEPSAGTHSRADSAAESLSAASEHEVLRHQLEEAAELAAKLLASEPQGEEGEGQLEAAMLGLDEVIERASAAGVSAKYGKKVRRKLQLYLNELRGIPPPEPAAAEPEAPAPAAAVPPLPKQAHSRAAAARPPPPPLQQQQHVNGHAAAAGARSAPSPPPSTAPKPAAAKPPPPGFAPVQQAAARPTSASSKAPYKPLAAAAQRPPAQAAAAPLPRPAWGQPAMAPTPQPTQQPALAAGLAAHQQPPQYAAPAAAAGGSQSLFSAPPGGTSLFSSQPSAAPAPPPQPQQPLMPAGTTSGGSLFAAPPAVGTSSSSLFATPPGRAPMQPAFASLAAFTGGAAGTSAAAAAMPGGSSAGASLASQFADLDIGELQQAGYESFAAGGDMQGASAAGQPSLLFSSVGAGSGGLGGLQLEPLDSAGAELLSRDLLGEIDGVPPPPSSAQPLQAPSVSLTLPDATTSLFGPLAPNPAANPPTATSSFSAFRSLW